MERKKIVVLAAGVLIAGICCALPFRRPLGQSSPPPAAAPANSPIRAAASPVLDAKNPRPTLSAAPPAREETSAAPGPAPIAAGGSEKDDPPPPVAPPPAVAGPPASTPMSDAAGNAVAAPVTAATAKPPRPQTWQRHRVQDGDSLAKLAQRYLGDPAREAEIYAVNREVLSDPAILPIGVWLRMPAE